MVTYIWTKYGDGAAQKWTSEKQVILQQPSYSQAILSRHAERVKVTRACINLKLSSLYLESMAINTEMVDDPWDHKLMNEKHGIEDKILHCKIELKDEVEMKQTKPRR